MEPESQEEGLQHRFLNQSNLPEGGSLNQTVLGDQDSGQKSKTSVSVSDLIGPPANSKKQKSKPTAKKLSAKNCERCGKIFTSQRNLRKHIESVHEGKRNFSCGHCDKKYAQSKDLSSHISRIHQNQQHNKCPHCDINFASKHILQKHIEVLHDKKKPFTCNNCDKTFGAKLGLQRHAKNCNNLKLI